MFLVPSHSYQNLRSIFGMSSQSTIDGVCLFGKMKTSGVILVILSPLSQSTLARELCRICVSCAALNVAGFSYQNL